jgi:hypothetical protein
MGNLVLLSILLAPVVIPMISASDPSPARGLRKTILYFFLWNAFYLFAIRFIYPRL